MNLDQIAELQTRVDNGDTIWYRDTEDHLVKVVDVRQALCFRGGTPRSEAVSAYYYWYVLLAEDIAHGYDGDCEVSLEHDEVLASDFLFIETRKALEAA